MFQANNFRCLIFHLGREWSRRWADLRFSCECNGLIHPHLNYKKINVKKMLSPTYHTMRSPIPVPTTRRRHSLAPETVALATPPTRVIPSPLAITSNPLNGSLVNRSSSCKVTHHSNARAVPPIPPRLLLHAHVQCRRSFNLSSPSGASAHSSQASHLLAIDSKIEQAMDLVKTHLMFAVREEVEHLRAKIVELETTVL